MLFIMVGNGFVIYANDSISYRPQNKEELFNLRHAQLRNAIERILGVVKCRFPILKSQFECLIENQGRMILAIVPCVTISTWRIASLNLIHGKN